MKDLNRQANGDRRHGTKADMALAAHGAAQVPYTGKQGQYLAFIYYYTKMHGRAPSEADMQGYFRVSPASESERISILALNELASDT